MSNIQRFRETKVPNWIDLSAKNKITKKLAVPLSATIQKSPQGIKNCKCKIKRFRV